MTGIAGQPGEGPQRARRLLPPEGRRPVLDRLAALAAQLLGMPDAQVSLLSDHQTVAAGAGSASAQVGVISELADSLCRVTVHQAGPLRVEDAAADERVNRLSPVTSGQVGAYLGVPLVTSDGVLVGAFCVFGPAPRSWSDADVALLTQLAGAVVAELELAALSLDFDRERMRWALAVEAAGIGSFDWDIGTGRLDWDDRMQELFGYEPGEFLPRIEEGFRRIHADDRPAVDAAVEGALRVCGDYRAEFRVEHSSGRETWVAARGRALPGPDGVAVRLIGTAQDVTESRTARDEAARLLETLAVGFTSIDADWVVTYLNAAGAAVVGYTAEELVGQVLWDAFPGLSDLEFGRQYRHVVATGDSAEFEAYYPHLDCWYEVRAVATGSGLSLYFTDITRRHLDAEAALASTERLSLLARVGQVLTEIPDIDAAIRELAALVVPMLADWTLITVRDDQGRFHDIGRAHVDPAMREALDIFAEHVMASVTDEAALSIVTRTGEPMLIGDYTRTWLDRSLADAATRDLVRPLQPQTILTIPLAGRQSVLGALSLVRCPGRPDPTVAETETAVEVGRRVGVALENAQLLRAQRRLSETLQDSLLSDPPQRDDLQLAVRYQAAAPDAAVGGDWHDSFVLPDGATAVVVGDVSGHDRNAAAAMGQVRALLRATAYAVEKPPALVLAALDAAMRGLEVDTLATCILARIEQTEQQRASGMRLLRWSNAGHPPPMLVLPDGTVRVLSTAADLLLGLDADTARADHTELLPVGSTVLFFTDGLVERRGENLDDGLDRLEALLAQVGALPLEQLCDALLRSLARAADDDIALLAVRLHPQPPA